MTDAIVDEPSFHNGYPQLPGLDDAWQPPAPSGVVVEPNDVAALDQLSKILTHIRYLATARPDGAFAQIEILAAAMAKTPRLLAEGAPFGARRTLELERMAGERALAMATTQNAPSACSVDRVIAELFDRDQRYA
ncbi:hypothetical protein [Rhodanobacter denitrificans]|uniref:hypothetical protein n=1 Tax=Rhodanobacter denitrificans TaxID=666685 RepID=UPI001F3B1A58|nr:hypothetical protein [Rhodanobacter denitrificans]UJJ60642.1 hypothetical protein LRK55_19600 [Rhodanobacter denitrificans]